MHPGHREGTCLPRRQTLKCRVRTTPSSTGVSHLGMWWGSGINLNKDLHVEGAECPTMTQSVNSEFLWSGSEWPFLSFRSWSRNHPKADIALANPDQFRSRKVAIALNACFGGVPNIEAMLGEGRFCQIQILSGQLVE